MRLSVPYTKSVEPSYKSKKLTITLKEAVQRSIEEFAEQKEIEEKDSFPKLRDFLPEQVANELDKVELDKLTREDLHLVGKFHYRYAIYILDKLDKMKSELEEEGYTGMGLSNKIAYYCEFDNKKEGFKVDCAKSLERVKQALSLDDPKEKNETEKDYSQTKFDILETRFKSLTRILDLYYHDKGPQTEPKKKKKVPHVKPDLTPLTYRDKFGKGVPLPESVISPRKGGLPLRRSVRFALGVFKDVQESLDDTGYDISYKPKSEKKESKNSKAKTDDHLLADEGSPKKKERGAKRKRREIGIGGDSDSDYENDNDNDPSSDYDDKLPKSRNTNKKSKNKSTSPSSEEEKSPLANSTLDSAETPVLQTVQQTAQHSLPPSPHSYYFPRGIPLITPMGHPPHPGYYATSITNYPMLTLPPGYYISLPFPHRAGHVIAIPMPGSYPSAPGLIEIPVGVHPPLGYAIAPFPPQLMQPVFPHAYPPPPVAPPQPLPPPPHSTYVHPHPGHYAMFGSQPAGPTGAPAQAEQKDQEAGSVQTSSSQKITRA